ncbi:MAG: hypothetical protein FJZ78_08930 [Bacteroidetes bacterium]|nr:hypothetical protein [Bacteroidota bacterium]
MKFLPFSIGLLIFSFQGVVSRSLLPDRMVGHWRGHLQVWSKGVKQDSVAVELTIAPLGQDRWKWRMDYKSEKNPMVKDYELRIKDRAQQIYLTDEGGGVVLEDYVFGNKMFSFFKTHDVWLSSTHELVDGKIIFEVTAGKQLNDSSAEVVNYSMTTLQRAVLFRSK